MLEELVADRTPGRHGYMSNAGYPETRVAVAAQLSKEQGVDLTGAHVVMTVGAGGALNVILKAILDPGDEVIVPTPYFVEYGSYVDNHGGVLRPVPTTADFDLDIDAIAAAIGPRTKAVLINSPHNPTGRVYPAESLQALGDLLRRKSDESGCVIYLISPTNPTGGSCTTDSRCPRSWPPTRTASSRRATRRSCRSRGRGSGTRPPTRPSRTSTPWWKLSP